MDRLFGPILPWFAIAYGKKFSGKSVLARFLVWEYRNDFSYIVVFSSTAGANKGYDFLPDAYVHTSYDAELVEKIIAKQAALWGSGRKVQCLIILDDCIGMQNFKAHNAGDELLKLFTANRHYGISLFISTQSPKALPPCARANADISFIFKSLNVSLEIMYQELGHLPRREFYAFVKRYTDNWQILMYNAREQDSNKQFSVMKVPEQFLAKSFKLKY